MQFQQISGRHTNMACMHTAVMWLLWSEAIRLLHKILHTDDDTQENGFPNMYPAMIGAVRVLGKSTKENFIICSEFQNIFESWQCLVKEAFEGDCDMHNSFLSPRHI